MLTYTQIMVADGNVFETWKCQRFFNPRNFLHVYRLGKVRFRTDTRQRCTRKALEEDGWKLDHSYQH